MLASSKHKYSKTLAFPDTYYELIINVLQSVELFCAYGLTATDFSEVRHNEHRGFEHELLYIFGKDVKLVERFGNSDKLVSLYIKFNKLENCYVIVVSLHEQKYPLKYYFK